MNQGRVDLTTGRPAGANDASNDASSAGTFRERTLSGGSSFGWVSLGWVSLGWVSVVVSRGFSAMMQDSCAVEDGNVKIKERNDDIAQWRP